MLKFFIYICCKNYISVLDDNFIINAMEKYYLQSEFK